MEDLTLRRLSFPYAIRVASGSFLSLPLSLFVSPRNVRVRVLAAGVPVILREDAHARSIVYVYRTS